MKEYAELGVDRLVVNLGSQRPERSTSACPRSRIWPGSPPSSRPTMLEVPDEKRRYSVFFGAASVIQEAASGPGAVPATRCQIFSRRDEQTKALWIAWQTTLQKIIVDLRRRLEALTAERDDALAQQAAATEVLQVINSSTGDLTPAFDMIVEKAVRLCDASGGTLWLVKDGMARATGGRRRSRRRFTNMSPRESVPVRYVLGRDGQHRPYIHTLDLKATQPYKEGVPFSSPALISARRERF